MNEELINITTVEKINQLTKENKKIKENQKKLIDLLPTMYNKKMITMEAWNKIEKILK